MKRIAAAFLTILCQQVYAEPLVWIDQGLEAYANQSYKHAYDAFYQAAQAGHSEAQCLVGLMQIAGQGTTPQTRQGLAWLKKAEAAKNPCASRLQAQLYLGGVVVPFNEKKAIAYIQQAVDFGYFRAPLDLISFYNANDDVEKAVAVREKLIKDLIASPYHQDPDIQFLIGALYYELNQIELSFQWHLKAALQHNPKSQTHVGLSYFQQAQPELALEWIKKAAEQKDAQAQYILGRMYMSTPTIDYGQAQYWLLQAIDQQHAEAMLTLGDLLIKIVNPPPLEAVEYYLQAIEHKSIDAYLRIADLYATGHILPQNDLFAYIFYKHIYVLLLTPQEYIVEDQEKSFLYAVNQTNALEKTLLARDPIYSPDIDYSQPVKDVRAQIKTPQTLRQFVLNTLKQASPVSNEKP